ncbi:C2 domain-containing protein 3 [Geranomyces variabilis]|nr:C2 domain-containing protein 3 [Geranomyces variabilis]
MTLPSPSNLPTPSPVVSVPPNLAGNVNYFLHVTIARIAWSAPPTASKPLNALNQARTGNPDTPPARSLSQTGARVRLTWWGETGSGTIFQPYNSGLREPTKRVQPPTSSLPVPLIRAKTWTAAGASPQPAANSTSHHLYSMSNSSPEHPQAGKITVAFPVRCYKTQLSKYFRDMGPLALQVLVDGRTVGEVVVPNLAALVSGSPVNDFFPIYEKTDASLNSSKIGKRRKLGDLHLSIILESAVVGSTSNAQRHVDTAKQYATPPATTARPQLQRHQTFGVNPSTPREPESEQFIARPVAISDTKIASMTSTPQPQFSASYNNKPEDLRSDAAKLRSTGTSPLLREADQLNETIADLPEPEDEVISEMLRTNEVSTNLVGSVNAQRAESESGRQKQMVTAQQAVTEAAATDAAVSEQHARATATNTESLVPAKNEPFAECDISGKHSPSSDDEEDSDLLEDDVLIEALNSAKGRRLIDSNSRPRNEPTLKGQNVDPSQYSDDLDVDDDDDEDPDLSDDERKRRAVLDIARKQHRKRAARAATATTAAASQPSPRNSILSIDKLTSLGRADSVKVTIGTLELLPDVVPHTPTALLATYSLPDAPGTSNVARSKSLPRLAVSRNASRRPVGALTGSLGAETSSTDAPKYTTAFDHARVAPCTFDAALVDLWLKARIGFRVTAEHRRAVGGRVPLAERIEEWALEGSFNCADVLSSNNLTYTVKIPLYRAAGKMMDAKPAARARVDTRAGAGRRASRPVVVGHLEVSIALLSGTVVRPRAEVAGRASVSRTASPTRRDDAAAYRFSSTNKPYYFHLTITTARSLAILPSLDATSSIMLYLVVRLFSASTPPIETPPVLFKSPFDLKTGRLNSPPDFGFAYTVPLAVTPEFLETHADTPLVAEVWIIDSEDPAPRASIAGGPRMTRTEVKALDLVDRGAKLLGLVKLPFSHLLSTLAAGWDAQTAQRDQEDTAPEDLPVMVPGAEYCILDPFTGSAKGWVNAFMALGTWDQIKKVRKPVVWAGQGEADDQPPMTAAAATSKPPVLRPHHKTAHSRRGKPAKAACKMAVTIHNACGLRGLINAVLDSRAPPTSRTRGGQHRYTPLDYARDVGVNAYVRFTPFPASMYRAAANSDAEDGYDSADGASNRSRSPSPERHAAGVQSTDAPEFETRIMAQTFAPVWKHNTTLSVRDNNGDLMRWMRHGGEARGEIWHRVPRNIADDDGAEGEENSRDVLLGTFRVPLRDVVTKQKGLDRVWVPVVASRGDEDDQETRIDEADAAVRVSIKLADGFDFGVSHEYAPGGAAENWWCALTVAIGKIRAPAGHRHHPVHRNGETDKERHSSRQLYLRWRHPRTSKSRASLEESSDSRSDADDDWQVVTSCPVPAKHHQPRHGYHAAVLTADMKYRQTVDVEMTPSVMRGYHDHRMEIQVFRTSVDLEDVSPSRTTEVGVLVGAAHVDLSDAFTKAKVALRKRKDAGRDRNVDGEDVFVVEGSFPLIDPTSPDLCGARIQLRVDVSPLLVPPIAPKLPSGEFAVTERQRPKPSSPPVTMEADNITTSPVKASAPLREDAQPHIPFEIAVEKAMKLPLVDDPLSGYMRSPFVPHDAPQLAPPNTFVTFEWSKDRASEPNDSQKRTNPQSFSTDLIPSLRCPNWNYVVTVTYQKTEAALRALKAGRSIEFSVWHSPDLPGIGRGSGSRRRSQRRVDGDDLARVQLLGTATVDLGGLFGGLREIYGWYHVLDEQKASQGQLLLRVTPKINLAVALRELTGGEDPAVVRRSSTHSRRRRRLQDACGESLLVAGASVSPPRHNQGPPPMAVAFPAAADGSDALFAAAASTAHAAAFSSRPPRELNTSTHSVDTWVWTGASWEHRHVDVLRASTDVTETGHQNVARDEAGKDASVVHEASPGRSPSGVEARFRRSRGELDALTAQLRRRSAADSPVIPALILRSPSPPSSPPPLPLREHLGRDLFARGKSESVSSQPTTPRAASPIGDLNTERVASPTPNRIVPLNSDDSARDDAEQAAGELRVSHLGEPRTSSPVERYDADAAAVDADASPSPTPVPPVRDDSLENKALPADEAKPVKDAGIHKRVPSPQEQYRLDKALSVAAAASAKEDVVDDDVERVDLAAVGTASGRLDHLPATHISTTAADDTWKRLEGRIEAIRADICLNQSRELEQELADNMSGAESNGDNEPSPAAIAPKRFGPYRDSSDDDEESDGGNDLGTHGYRRDVGSSVRVRVPDERNAACDEQGSEDDTDDERRRLDMPPRAGTTRWRMKHPRQANKENLRLVPDVDSATGCDDQQDDEDAADTTSDDEIYGILAYRRMAAATANPASSNSAMAARRALARTTATRTQPYDPFGVRIPAPPRAAWKAAPDSSDTDGSESGRRGNVKTRVTVSSTTVLKSLHRKTVSDVTAASDSAARPGRDWRDALAAMSKDRRERLERVFRDEVEESGAAAGDAESDA